MAEEISRSVATLPVLPAQVGELARLRDDPATSVADVERVVRLDASLTANLLRVANSAYFRAERPCANLRDALVRLGIAKVTELALGDAFRALMPDELPGYGLSAEAFWRHCAAVAVISDRIGKGAGVRESFFTAGLLHDMGKLVVGTFLAERREQIERTMEVQLTFVEAEHQELGTDHGEVGLAVGQRWNLPPSVVAVAAHHHHPLTAPEPQRLIVSAVHVADAIAHALGHGADMGGLQRHVESAVLPSLRLDELAIEHLCRSALEDVLKLGDALAGRGSGGP